VGQVPVYAELLNFDADGLGFTRPTWSLSSPAEYRFRDTDPAHYDVFDVPYRIQPSADPVPVDATLVAERGRHSLWQIAVDGTIEVVDTGEPITADRTNLGVQIAPWLNSELPEADVHPGIAFAGVEAPVATAPSGVLPSSPPGTVVDATLALDEGRASATVQMDRPGAVILKASFDNRWRVTVDGEVLDAQMFAPSFVGRMVPPGRHHVTFEYVPFPRYDLLLLIGAGTFVGLLLASRVRRSRGEPTESTNERALAPEGAPLP
jgi:hypothetical protein